MATRKGYGQVERQHMAAPHNGQIYAQLPAYTDANTKMAQLENGQFLKYDYRNGKAWKGTANDGLEWFLVYNEEKLYDERYQNHRHFAMKASEMADGTIYPRLLRTFVGDIFTTNTFRTSGGATVTSGDQEITIDDFAIGDFLKIDNDGWLVKVENKPASGIVFQVVPHFTQIENSNATYTLPDKQFAVKLQRIQ